MTKKINQLSQAPESGTTKQNQIQQTTGPIILFALTAEQNDESKEILWWANIIICRRSTSDEKYDMKALKSQFSWIEKQITYLHNPNDVAKNLKADKKNIVFLGQYFDVSTTWSHTAHVVKDTWYTMGIDTHVVMVTTIKLSPWELYNVDEYYNISPGHDDEKNTIVQHLKKMVNTPDEIKRQKKTKWLELEAKLWLLHGFLAEKVPENLPEILMEYEKAYTELKKSWEECTDTSDPKYNEAFRKFRDILLKDV